MLLRCQSETAFFPLVDQLYADQKGWMGRIQALPREQLEAIQSMPPSAAAAAVVRGAGLDEFFRQRGMPSAQIQACLADPAGLAQLAAIKARGDSEGVNGTPSFFINGRFAEGATSWPRLEAELRAEIP